MRALPAPAAIFGRVARRPRAARPPPPRQWRAARCPSFLQLRAAGEPAATRNLFEFNHAQRSPIRARFEPRGPERGRGATASSLCLKLGQFEPWAAGRDGWVSGGWLGWEKLPKPACAVSFSRKLALSLSLSLSPIPPSFLPPGDLHRPRSVFCQRPSPYASNKQLPSNRVKFFARPGPHMSNRVKFSARAGPHMSNRVKFSPAPGPTCQIMSNFWAAPGPSVGCMSNFCLPGGPCQILAGDVKFWWACQIFGGPRAPTIVYPGPVDLYSTGIVAM